MEARCVTAGAGLLALFLGGCAPGGEVGGAPAYRRLELSVAPGADELPAPETLGRWESGHELKELAFDGPGEMQKGRDRLRCPAGEEVTVHLPGPFAHADPLRIAVRAVGPGRNVFLVRAFIGQRVVADAVERKFRAADEPGTFELELSPRPSAEPGDLRAIERLELVLRPQVKTLDLYGVHVTAVPAAHRFPERALDGTDLVSLDGVMHRASCLVPGRPLVTRFVPEPGFDLTFTHVVPEALRDERTAWVVLTLRAGETESVHEYTALDEADPTWNQVRVGLDGFRGREVEARFELRMEPPGSGAVALGEPALARRGPSPPTVLLITSDTHRADHVALDAGARVDTPALTALAARGVTFLDAYSATNNTTPSHVSLFTGRHPRDTGVVENGLRLAEAAPTLAERFREAGWATVAAVSSAPVDHRLSGLGQGFDRFFARYNTASRDAPEAIGGAVRFVPEFSGLPLFVWVHLFDAHAPYEPPAELVARYYDPQLDPRDAARPDAQPELAPAWAADVVDPAYTEALYRGEITYLDRELARLLGHGRFRRGIVAFTSDHGEELRHGAAPFDHRGVSPATLAVPLILASPDLPAGARVDGPVELIDLGRTLLDLAGLQGAAFPGRSLVDAARSGQVTTAPRFALEAYGLSASVQSERWMLTLVLNLRREEREAGRDDRLHAVALYDLESDPYLRTDVRDAHPRVAATLRARLVDWLGAADDTGWSERSEGDAAAVQAELAALGYTDESVERSGRWMDPDCDCVNCAAFRE